MPRQKPKDKIERLRLELAQKQAQLKAEEAREKETARKSDTRRKVIAGALAVEHMEKNPTSDFAKVLGKLLDEYVTRPMDRALFPNLPAPSPANPVPQPQPAAMEVTQVAAE
jgi:hypothetical protein